MTPSGIEPATFRLVTQCPQEYREPIITNKLHDNFIYHRSQDYTLKRFDYFLQPSSGSFEIQRKFVSGKWQNKS
jgi:hypothetical protein